MCSSLTQGSIYPNYKLVSCIMCTMHMIKSTDKYAGFDQIPMVHHTSKLLCRKRDFAMDVNFVCDEKLLNKSNEV